MTYTEGDGPITELDVEEAWRLLGSQRLGRLAYCMAGSPYVVPVNYVAADRRLYFRTAEGNKLFGVTLDGRIAFEVDVVDGDEARSVIVHGTARELVTEDEHEYVSGLGLRSWVPTHKYHDVEIVPDEVTGRLFRLGQEPEPVL